MDEAGGADFQAIGLVGAVGNQVDAKLAFRVFDGSIHLTRRQAVTFREQFEMVDQRLHVVLHGCAPGRDQFVVVDDDRARVVAQPVHTLPDNGIGLAHLFHPHQIAIVTVSVLADRDGKIQLLVHFIGLFSAQVPLHPRTAQHGAGKTQRDGPFRFDHTDAHGALLPDAVIGEQGFIFINTRREMLGERGNKVQQRTLAGFIHLRHFRPGAVGGDLIVRHFRRQVPVHTTGSVVGGVHPGARYRLVAVHQVFPLPEAIQEHAHGADVQAVRAQPHEVVEDTGNLVEHNPDVTRPDGRGDAQQPFNGQHVGVLVAHHGHVVQAVHVTDALVIGFTLSQFFRAPVQQPDMRVGALDHLSIHLQHQA